jgi:hypothetical protein
VTGAALDLVSNNFTVTAPTPQTLTLTWTAQPTTTVTGAHFAPQLALTVYPIGAMGVPVTLAVTSGNCSVTGMTTVTSQPEVSQAPGTVVFDLTAGNAGTNCVITASAPNATSITSNPFSIIMNGLPPQPLLTRFPVSRKP